MTVLTVLTGFSLDSVMSRPDLFSSPLPAGRPSFSRKRKKDRMPVRKTSKSDEMTHIPVYTHAVYPSC